MRSQKIHFKNRTGYTLAARLELPIDGHPLAYAVFAHVFTGNKSLSATRYISRALTLSRIAVLRFDFTGLGESEGDFSDSNFSSNVEDLLAAARYLEEHHRAPAILVGHSLGGAAVIFAAAELLAVKAVAIIGAPAEPEHVKRLLADSVPAIEKQGNAGVTIDGRRFTIKKQFLDDLQNKNLYPVLRKLRKALLVLHSPQDKIVDISNAAKIYEAAYHPKSFITLDGADHMLSDKRDACYAGSVISSWVQRYIEVPPQEQLQTEKQVVARLGQEGYTTDILAGRHALLADEPLSVGGNDFGPTPYGLLNAALGACTVMTLQMYARRKKWDLQEVKAHLAHIKSYAEDCKDCEKAGSKLDRFELLLELKGNLNAEQKARLLEIADRCPVHRTLEGVPTFKTTLVELPPQSGNNQS